MGTLINVDSNVKLASLRQFQIAIKSVKFKLI